MAINAFEAALRVYNENNFPMDWAKIQNNLGAAYVKLPFGDRRENLTKAISCFENALKIWTPQAFPDYHQIAATHLKGTQSELEKLLLK
jgi:tetratricopeptide (TPR) repeat protein